MNLPQHKIKLPDRHLKNAFITENHLSLWQATQTKTKYR